MVKTRNLNKASGPIAKKQRGDLSRAGKKQRECATSEEDSPEQFGKRFQSDEKVKRYKAFSKNNFIPERRVELQPGQYDDFQHELQRRNWLKLASLPKHFNPKVVKYFYANAYTLGEEGPRVSFVLGRRVLYDRATISAYLEDHLGLEEAKLCAYQNSIRSSPPSFNYKEVLDTLCIPGTLMEESRNVVERAEMKVLTEIWMTFMTSNINPTLHTSNINLYYAGLLYCIIQKKTVDIAKIISDDIHRIATSEKPMPLCFPSLITELCRFQRVIIPEYPQLDIRPPINEKFIQRHCKKEEALPPPSPLLPPPPDTPQSSPDNPTTQQQIQLILAQQDAIRIEQVEQRDYLELVSRQQRATYRATTSMYSHIRRFFQRQGPEPFVWPTDDQFSSYAE
ncbi:uncharacterized protein LOC130738692 [Lotus japonicus]|uniref:uncharacterized protein LOC130738692 n=1 Tax=Lotus japonicus TaxID=34305 RepID=UPI00258E89E0|nr:uncharacterized protein LOC130738692 [Lotus japonicus]